MKSPRRAVRESLLSREDWKITLILAAIFCTVSFIAGFIGALLGGAW